MNEPSTSADRPVAEQAAEQLRYARLLDVLTRIGLAVLVLSFAAYAFGLMPPSIEHDRLPEVWSLPLAQFLEQTGSPTGWRWLALLQHGDIAGLVGIVILAGCSLVCLLALVPLYWRRGDRAFAALCVAEVAVVLFAASGVLTGGH